MTQIWQIIANHVDANKLNHEGNPMLPGNISKSNAERILQWRCSQ